MVESEFIPPKDVCPTCKPHAWHGLMCIVSKSTFTNGIYIHEKCKCPPNFVEESDG